MYGVGCKFQWFYIAVETFYLNQNYMRLFFLSLFLLLLVACKEQSTALTVADYFNYGDTGVQSAGVKMIPIQTSVGEFKVWTKRFGNN